MILSQLLRGFTKGIREYDTLDAVIFANAFQKAVETAYKAVTKMLIFSMVMPVKASTLYFTLLIKLSETAEMLTP